MWQRGRLSKFFFFCCCCWPNILSWGFHRHGQDSGASSQSLQLLLPSFYLFWEDCRCSPRPSFCFERIRIGKVVSDGCETGVGILSWEFYCLKKQNIRLYFSWTSLVNAMGCSFVSSVFFFFFLLRTATRVALPPLFLWISSKVINVVYWAEACAVPWFVKPFFTRLRYITCFDFHLRFLSECANLLHTKPVRWTTPTACVRLLKPLTGVGHMVIETPINSHFVEIQLEQFIGLWLVDY